MQATIDIGTLIIKTPAVCGGRPRIAGTRITIQNIAINFNAGMSSEEIVMQRTHLTQAQVYAALAYYYANKEAIDIQIAKYYQEFETLSIENPESQQKPT